MFKVELFFVDICFPLAIGHFLGHSYKFYKKYQLMSTQEELFFVDFYDAHDNSTKINKK